MSGLTVRLYENGREVDVLDSLEAALGLQAQLEETSARRTSGWLFNQPREPLPLNLMQPAGAPLTRLLSGKGFIP